jgi:hypothetical protein
MGILILNCNNCNAATPRNKTGKNTKKCRKIREPQWECRTFAASFKND